MKFLIHNEINPKFLSYTIVIVMKKTYFISSSSFWDDNDLRTVEFGRHLFGVCDRGAVSWRTKEQENTQRPRKGLATTGYLVLRDPAVITGIRRKGGHPRARGNSACASPMCAHERGVLVIRDEWHASCWRNVPNYVFFKGVSIRLDGRRVRGGWVAYTHQFSTPPSPRLHRTPQKQKTLLLTHYQHISC